MIFRHRYVRLGARLSAIAAAALLCGCIGERDLSTTEPSFYRSLAAKDAPKTERYLTQLEEGSLDPARISRKVIEGLAGILRVDPSLLDQAGGATFRPAPMFRASAPPSAGTARNMEVLADMLTAKAPVEDWDEVDQLFQGGR